MKRQSLFYICSLVLSGCFFACQPNASNHSVSLITPYDSVNILGNDTIQKSDTAILEVPDEYESDTALYNAVAPNIDAAIGDELLQRRLDSVKGLL